MWFKREISDKKIVLANTEIMCWQLSKTYSEDEFLQKANNFFNEINALLKSLLEEGARKTMII